MPAVKSVMFFVFVSGLAAAISQVPRRRCRQKVGLWRELGFDPGYNKRRSGHRAAAAQDLSAEPDPLDA